MFLHGGLLHIGGNLLFLWVFGNNVEDAFGKVGYALFYLVGGVVATLTHVVLNLDSTVRARRRIGAIAAVMGAYLCCTPGPRCAPWCSSSSSTCRPDRARVLVRAAVLHRPQRGGGLGRHVGGFLFGVLVGLLVAPSSTPSRPGSSTRPRLRDSWGNHPPRRLGQLALSAAHGRLPGAPRRVLGGHERRQVGGHHVGRRGHRQVGLPRHLTARGRCGSRGGDCEAPVGVRAVADHRPSPPTIARTRSAMGWCGLPAMVGETPVA